LNDEKKKTKTATNDITGDSINSKSSNQKYRDNWDIIFGKKNADNSSKIKTS
jgi:hypothetical protein